MRKRKIMKSFSYFYFYSSCVMWKYIKSLIKANTGNSSKSFGLVLSVIVGALIGICVCITLLFDVLSDGVITTDLDGLGWFLLCDGVYMFGGGLNKTISEFSETRKNIVPKRKRKEEELESDEDV